MSHRVGSTFAFICTLLAPFAAHAQTTSSAAWLGPARPQSAPNVAPPAYPQSYAQPVYPQANGSRSYPQAYHHAGYAAPTYRGAGTLTPANYAYAGNAGYVTYPAYGTSYPQGYAAAGTWGTPRAEAPAPRVQTKDNLHYIEIGMGAFVPTDSGNFAKVGLEANVWALHGGWVPNSGVFLTLDAATGFDVGCLAVRATDGCKGHFRIHWLAVGPFFNTGTPMIAPEVTRPWDLMALTGAEVRLWKGMTAKATANWFLPSPWGVYDYEKQRAEGALNGTASTLAPGSAQAQTLNPMDGVESILGHALTHPQINLMGMWEF